MRIYPTSLTLALALGGVAAIAQQRPPVAVAPRGTTQTMPPAPKANSPLTSAANAQSRAQVNAGTVSGAIFWDSQRVAYSPAAPCQGLAVNLSEITGTGVHALGTTEQFLAQPSPQPGAHLAICGYTFQRVPEGVALQVQINLGSLAANVSAIGPFPLTAIGALVKIPGGPCNGVSNLGAASAAELETGWQSCGDHASNVNFQLLPRSGSVTGPTSAGPLLPQQPGMLLPAKSGEANPGPINRAGASAPAALIGLLRQGGTLQVISGRRASYAQTSDAALITVLRQQRQAGQLAGESTMSAQPPSNLSRTAAAPNLKVRPDYTPSSLLTAKENAACQRQEAAGTGQASILRVDGSAQPATFSPDPQANPYTFVGCGFGDAKGTLQLRLFDQTNIGDYTRFTLNFSVQSWTDHQITASLDPNTSGVPDWLTTQLVLDGANSIYGMGQFVARRNTVALDSLPQSQATLYNAGSPDFLSPASNYYGLNGTLAVMRQGLTGPVAGQDQFTLKLANGYVVDSTQTDLLVSNVSGNVSVQPATVNGSTIVLTYPVVSVPSGNSTVYYSIYGLKIWVTGPAGLNPLGP